MLNRAQDIRAFILENVVNHPNDIVAITAEHFAITRTTVHRHLNHLITNNHIIKSGTTRDIKYHLATSLNIDLNFTIDKQLSEFDIFNQYFAPLLQNFPKNIYDICEYGFTEMVNNAIEHSLGTKLQILSNYKNHQLNLIIQDNGIGIFKKFYDYFELEDMRESILQMSKGKMTTDPANHTGEGIFFTSRMFDSFEIQANTLIYIKDNLEDDWSVASTDNTKKGTMISLILDTESKRQIGDVFKRFQELETYDFNRTEIHVELAKYCHETLISRSQAKRIVRGLEKFKHITLDFKGVRLVGQGFVDDIFRVFQNKHPDIEITYINANDDVKFMIKRGLPK